MKWFYSAMAVFLVALSWAPRNHISAAQSQASSSIEDIRKELMQLPYYGVFDFLAFKYQKGTAELMGYAYHPGLKQARSERPSEPPASIPWSNKVEDLPPLPNDDELRWKVYYAIYRDPFLSRYAPGGGMLWGHRHSFGGGFHGMNFTGMEGMEPAGDYPIHIVVKNGHIQLLGVVDSEGDKNLAGTRARQVPGSFGMTNELAVENTGDQSTKWWGGR
jgi:hyperosmotically inducible periplasmic protein